MVVTVAFASCAIACKFEDCQSCKIKLSANSSASSNIALIKQPNRKLTQQASQSYHNSIHSATHTMPASPTIAQGQTFYNDMVTNHELDTVVCTHYSSVTSRGSATDLAKEVAELRTRNSTLESRNSKLENIVGIQGYKLARLTERFDKLLNRLEVDILEEAPDSSKPRRHTRTFSEGNLHALLMNEDEDSHIGALSFFPQIEVDSRDETAVATRLSPLDSSDDNNEVSSWESSTGKATASLLTPVSLPITSLPHPPQSSADPVIHLRHLSYLPIIAVAVINLNLTISIFVNSVLIIQSSTELPAKDFAEFSTIRSEIFGRTRELWDDAVATAAGTSANDEGTDNSKEVSQDINAFWASDGVEKATLVSGVELDMSCGVLSLEETHQAAESSIAVTKVSWAEIESCEENWRMWWVRNVVEGSKEALNVGSRVDLRKLDEATRRMMASWVN